MFAFVGGFGQAALEPLFADFQHESIARGDFRESLKTYMTILLFLFLFVGIMGTTIYYGRESGLGHPTRVIPRSGAKTEIQKQARFAAGVSEEAQKVARAIEANPFWELANGFVAAIALASLLLCAEAMSMSAL